MAKRSENWQHKCKERWWAKKWRRGDKRKRTLQSSWKSRRVGTVKALLCVGILPTTGQRCSSLLPAYWPPPHLNAHSALRASIKYSFSKTSTYITNTTSVSPCWPDWIEQCVTPSEEQTIIRAASKGSAALAHSEQMIFLHTSSASKVHCFS